MAQAFIIIMVTYFVLVLFCNFKIKIRISLYTYITSYLSPMGVGRDWNSNCYESITIYKLHLLSNFRS